MEKELKMEKYSGFKLFFSREGDKVYGGFRKNRKVVSAGTKKEAFKLMKKVVDSLPSMVRNAYKRHSEVMERFEDL